MNQNIINEIAKNTAQNVAEIAEILEQHNKILDMLQKVVSSLNSRVATIEETITKLKN